MSDRPSKAWEERALAWAPFLCLLAVFLWPVILLRESFVFGDYGVQHFPWARHLYNGIRSGRLPFWTDLMACGFPLAAEGQVGAFYIPHLLLYKTLPFLAAYNWLVPLHFLVGGFGIYAYARSLSLSRPASGIAMLVFSFGSGFAGCFYNTGSLKTLCWLPLCLLILEKLRHAPLRPVLPALLGLAVIFSQQWNAGFSQMALYAFAYLVLHEAWTACEGSPETGWRGPRVLLTLCGALALGAGLALPQIAATAELLPLSVRAGQTAAFALWGSFPPPATASLVFPKWGNAMSMSFYAGILPLFLVSALAVFPRRPGVWRHAFLALAFLLLSFGRFNPLYAWFIEAANLTFLRTPAKFLFFTVTSIAVLAAFGYDAVISAADKEARRRFRRMLRAAVLGIAAAPFVASVFFRAGERLWLDLGARYVMTVVAEKGANAKPVEYYLGGMSAFLERMARSFSYEDPFNFVPIIFALASAAAIGLFLRKRMGKRKFMAAILLILTADLWIFTHFMGIGFTGNWKPVAGIESFPGEQTVRAFLRPGESIAEFAADPAREVLPPNKNMLYGIPHPGGYSPLLLKRHYELTKELGIADASLGRDVFSLEVWKKERSLLDLLGAAIVRSDTPLALKGLSLQAEEGGAYFYRNENVLPKVAGFYGWKVIADRTERLTFMKSEAYDSRVVILDEAPGTRHQAPSSNNIEAAEVLKDTPTEIIASITMKEPGVGWARVAAYPGWTVEVDGSKTPWFFAGHAFIGFWLDAGAHGVRLSYTPPHAALAWKVSGFLWAAVVIGLIFRGRRPVRGSARERT